MKNNMITALFVGFTLTLTAQDFFKEALYPSETVLKYSEEIALSDTQIDKIKTIYKQNSNQFSALKKELQASQDSLKELLNNTQVDEQASLKKLDRINELEQKLKYVRLQMLIRIKNEITSQQQEKLKEVLQDDNNGWNVVTGVKKDPKIVIKTAASITGKSPLYIVDGKVAESFHIDYELDTDEIETINVLKGDTAKLLYGKKAKNGVIVIHTKAGKKKDKE